MRRKDPLQGGPRGQRRQPLQVGQRFADALKGAGSPQAKAQAPQLFVSHCVSTQAWLQADSP